MPFWHARELDHRALPSRLRSGYAPGGWAVGAGHPSILIEHRRIWPLIRTLQRTTDPLFRRAGMDLDDG
jgi:hypothetical protein